MEKADGTVRVPADPTKLSQNQKKKLRTKKRLAASAQIKLLDIHSVQSLLDDLDRYEAIIIELLKFSSSANGQRIFQRCPTDG